MENKELDLLSQYAFEPPANEGEFEKLVKSLYQIHPDEAYILLQLSTMTWFRKNKREFTLLTQQICSHLKREQERAQKLKQEQAKLESRDFTISLLISIPLILLILRFLWRFIFVGNDLGTMISYVISFLVGSILLIYLIYRVVHWFAEQERLTKVLTEQSYPWKCLQCGMVVMGTIHGPYEGSSCPKCGGVMVLARFV